MLICWICADASLRFIELFYDPAPLIFYGPWVPRFLLFSPFDVGYWLFATYVVYLMPRELVAAVCLAIIIRFLLKGVWFSSSKGPRDLLGAVAAVFLVELARMVVFLPAYVLVGPLEVVRLPPGSGYFSLHLAVYVLLLVGVWIFSRICFAYPMAALYGRPRFRQSWQGTKSGSVVLLISILLLLLSFGLILGFSSTMMGRYLALAAMSPFWAWLFATQEALLGVLIDTILVVLVVVAFAKSTGFPAARISGTEAEKGELVRAFE